MNGIAATGSGAYFGLLVFPLYEGGRLVRSCCRLGRRAGIGAAALRPPSPPSEPQWVKMLRQMWRILFLHHAGQRGGLAIMLIRILRALEQKKLWLLMVWPPAAIEAPPRFLAEVTCVSISNAAAGILLHNNKGMESTANELMFTRRKRLN